MRSRSGASGAVVSVVMVASGSRVSCQRRSAQDVFDQGRPTASSWVTTVDATVRLDKTHRCVSHGCDETPRCATIGAEMSAETRPAKGRAPHRRDENGRGAGRPPADDLLVERGFGGVTIEGIAARAGVAKQTIYRWWPSKVDVLLDTLVEDAGRQLAIPDTGSAVDDTRRYLQLLAHFLTEDPAGKVLLALIGEAQDDAEVARV